MFLLDSFFKRISSDFRQKQLLPLKLLFFVHSSTMYVLYPYLTIHMRELGINVEETAIMSAVTPIVSIVMPPIAGVIADRIGNFKIILSLFSALGGAASLLLLLVPVGRVLISYPEYTILEVNSNQSLIQTMVAEPYPCMRPSNISLPVELRVEACGTICTRAPESFKPYDRGPKTVMEEGEAVLRTRSYTIIVRSLEQNLTDKYRYTLGSEDLQLYKEVVKNVDARYARKMKNKGHFPTSIRKLSDWKYFFPTSGLYSFKCSPEPDISEGNITCSVQLEREEVPSSIKNTVITYDVVLRNNPLSTDTFFNNYIMESMKPKFDNITSNKFWNLFGIDSESPETVSVEVPLLNKENALEVDGILRLHNCEPTCLATVPRVDICTNQDEVNEYDIRLTFWLYLTIRVFISMISGTAFAMFEGAVIAILREHKADYGLQRIYATIGGMISSPVSGWMIDSASAGKDFTDFRPAFYLYAALKIISAMLMLTINLEFKAPATNVLSDVLTVLKKVEIVALFITCFILGTAWGYIESFLFWLLQDLGASRSLMGITITVGGIAGLPLLVMSGPIIDKIGHANVLFIGFVFYAIRLLGYSLIYNPWMCLIFEAMESVTSSLSFTAAVTYAAKLSTMTTDSSIQGLLGGLYFGVGKGAGSLAGGFLMESVGTRPTYQIFALVTLLTGCIYYLFNKFYIIRHSKENLDKEVSTEKSATTNEKSNATNQTAPALANKDKEDIIPNIISETLPMHTAITFSNNYKSNDVVNNIAKLKLNKRRSSKKDLNVEENGGTYSNKAFDLGESNNATIQQQSNNLSDTR
ncbi:hypothetical protein O3M35_009014 [Rhynocoris fuscipes]|uniref:Major facilitator superfamily associated domain-containing protein n=1 Tax=Rhynocoris fuscipes TaxID=488301 RepID=A0AAW1D8E2_9HEMI